MKLLLDISRENLLFYQSTVTARKSWLQDHRDVATRYVAAFNEAVALIHGNPTMAKAGVEQGHQAD